MRIAYVVKGLGRGGAERVVLQTAAYLASRGHSVTLYNIEPREAALRTAVEAAGVEVLDVEVVGRRALAALLELCRDIRRRRPDVLFAHLPIAGIVGRLAALLTDRPLLYTEHSLVDRYAPLTRWLNLATYRLNSAVVAVSDAVERSIRRGLPWPPRLELIRNAVDLARLEAGAARRDAVRAALWPGLDPFVIGTVASLRPVKRLDLLLRAFARLHAERPATRLLIVGGGEELSRLQALAGELDLGGSATFTGWQEDAADYMAALDAYVLCSAFEGLPMALLEAMALGKPVVASAVGGVPEVVAHGRNGLLLEGDGAAALTAALRRVQDEPGLAAALGRQAARDIHAHWSFAAAGARLERLLVEVARRA